MAARSIHLNAQLDGAAPWIQGFATLAEAADKLDQIEGVTFVTMGASRVQDEELLENTFEGALHYDEDTLKKVFAAIQDVLSHQTPDAHELAVSVLNNLQNAGILFRERR